MTLKLIRQLEIIRAEWKKYKPDLEVDKDLKKDMLESLNQHIEDSREELLHEEENNYIEMELDLL